MIDIDALNTAVTELDDLLPRLASLFTAHTTPVEHQGGGRPKPQSTPPWNNDVAMLYFEIHGDARRFESALTLRLFKRATYRAGTDAHTLECLHRLPDLINHAIDCGLDTHQDQLAEMTTAVQSWPRKARALLDEARSTEQRWAKAPGDLRCAHCGKPLAIPPGWERASDLPDLICRNRHCDGRDSDGRPVRYAPTAWVAQLQEPEPPSTHLSASDAATEYGLTDDQVYVWHHRRPFTDLREDKYARRLFPREQIEARIARRRGGAA